LPLSKGCGAISRPGSFGERDEADGAEEAGGEGGIVREGGDFDGDGVGAFLEQAADFELMGRGEGGAGVVAVDEDAGGVGDFAEVEEPAAGGGDIEIDGVAGGAGEGGEVGVGEGFPGSEDGRMDGGGIFAGGVEEFDGPGAGDGKRRGGGGEVVPDGAFGGL